MKLAGALLVVLALTAVPAALGARATLESEIEMEDFSFRPARKVVPRGGPVVWKNRDRARHNATSLARRADGTRLFRTRTAGFRAELTARAPRTAGTYRYLCTVHPNMRGTLVVR
jgi:plastocyanin